MLNSIPVQPNVFNHLRGISRVVCCLSLIADVLHVEIALRVASRRIRRDPNLVDGSSGSVEEVVKLRRPRTLIGVPMHIRGRAGPCIRSVGRSCLTEEARSEVPAECKCANAGRYVYGNARATNRIGSGDTRCLTRVEQPKWVCELCRVVVPIDVRIDPAAKPNRISLRIPPAARRKLRQLIPEPVVVKPRAIHELPRKAQVHGDAGGRRHRPVGVIRAGPDDGLA